jgi:hypothetical protein
MNWASVIKNILICFCCCEGRGGVCETCSRGPGWVQGASPRCAANREFEVVEEQVAP